MHELSIAMSIMEAAAETLERNGGGRVVAVHLKLGPLSGVMKEALVSAYELAVENTEFADSKLRIEDVPVEVDCAVCRGARPVESIQDMKCRICGTASAKIARGRELEITAMEICDAQPATVG